MSSSSSLRKYLNGLSRYIQTDNDDNNDNDGKEWAKYVRLDKGSCPGGNDILISIQNQVDTLEDILASTRTIAGWEGVFAPHLRACVAYNVTHEYLNAFTYANESIMALNPHLMEYDKRIVPTVLCMAKEANMLCTLAEKESLQTGRKEVFDEVLKSFISTVRNAFGECFGHRVAREMAYSSRKLGSLALANIWFRLQFKVNSPRQCKAIVMIIKNDSFVPVAMENGTFPIAELVTYRFYTGKLAMYEEEFKTADTALSYALVHTPVKYYDNRRRILEALIPVKLHLGSLPSIPLLTKYKLHTYYQDIVLGIKDGHLTIFRKALDTYQETFIRMGVYLLLEKLQNLVIRTFIKKCATKIFLSPKLHLPTLVQLLNNENIGVPQTYPIDTDELECILANLVYKRFIRGYVSHNPPYLVTAKERPFPKIKEIVIGK